MLWLADEEYANTVKGACSGHRPGPEAPPLSARCDVLRVRNECCRGHWNGLIFPPHLAFAPAGRLVAVFGTVVNVCSRFDENVLHMSELGNVILRRWIATQLVGNDLARHRV